MDSNDATPIKEACDKCHVFVFRLSDVLSLPFHWRAQNGRADKRRRLISNKMFDFIRFASQSQSLFCLFPNGKEVN